MSNPITQLCMAAIRGGMPDEEIELHLAALMEGVWDHTIRETHAHGWIGSIELADMLERNPYRAEED